MSKINFSTGMPGIFGRRTSPTMGDDTVKIFLSTCGKLDDISKDLKELLRYVEDTTDETAEESESRLVKDIHHRVLEIKDTRKYQVEYMTLYMHEKDIERKARAEGCEEGHAAGLEEGRAKGLDEGRAEGRADAFRDAALHMYSMGKGTANIAELLDLDEEQIKAWIEDV